jgi:hypothetical protein
MADWQLLNNAKVISYNATAQAGVAHTAGSYVELCASAPFTGIAQVKFNAYQPGAAYLVTVAVGAAGSEVAVLSNLITQSGYSSSVAGVDAIFPIPIVIQKGMRVSFKIQSTSASALMDGALHLISSDFSGQHGYSVCDTLGATTASTRGTSIDPGVTISTKGAWTQFSASAARNYKAIAIGVGGQANYARTICYWQIDVGLGASPANAIIVPDYIPRSHDTGDMMLPPMSPIFPVHSPVGSQIHVRASCTINDASDRLLDVILYLLA